MKQLSNTRVTVRLRKVEDRKEWYVYIESYPVFVPGKKTPQRIREYLNRSVATVEWDKKRTARTETDGTKTYKPKRDDNGIIVCRSEKDQESMLYADGVRKLRQREYDNADLYSDTESAQAEQKERLQQNFIEYFGKVAAKRHVNSLNSIQINWQRTKDFLKQFAGDMLLFSQIDNRMAEEFKRFLLSAPCAGNRNGTISHNTAATYFSIFKAALKQAFVDGYLTVDLSAKIKGIQEQEENLNIALEYTRKTFVPYVSDKDIETLLRNVQAYANKLSLENLHPIKIGKELQSLDLLHFGWNIWNFFKPRNQMDVAHFLKKVFPDILKDVEVETIKRHLKDDERKGIIKIREILSE